MHVVAEMLGIFLLCVRVRIAAQIMLALCVYNDARYRGNSNAVLWAVLSGFFSTAGLVYLIVQLASKRFVACAARYRPIPSAEPVCPTCGAVSPEVYRFSPPEMREKQRKRRFLFLWLYIGLIVVAVIMMVFFMYTAFHNAMSILPYWR